MKFEKVTKREVEFDTEALAECMIDAFDADLTFYGTFENGDSLDEYDDYGENALFIERVRTEVLLETLDKLMTKEKLKMGNFGNIYPLVY